MSYSITKIMLYGEDTLWPLLWHKWSHSLFD